MTSRNIIIIVVSFSFLAASVFFVLTGVGSQPRCSATEPEKQVTDDGLIFTQEGTCVRARVGKKNFLFQDRTPDVLRAEYRESVSEVRRWLQPRWKKASDDLSEEEFADLTQDITLHWMYFYIVNGHKVRITGKDLDHPQSKDIIWSFAKRKYGEDSSRVREVASRIMGISEADFDKWLSAWKAYLEGM